MTTGNNMKITDMTIAVEWAGNVEAVISKIQNYSKLNTRNYEIDVTNHRFKNLKQVNIN